MTLNEKVETLFNITNDIDVTKKEMEPLQNNLRLLQRKEKMFKELILRDLELSGQTCIEYKNLKITCSSKSKLKRIKKDEKKDKIYSILQDVGVSDPYEITKMVMDSLNTQEMIGSLRIQKK